MKVVAWWMVLLFQESLLNNFNGLSASLQLRCEKKKITAYIGEEFILVCKYDTRQFLGNKKYWCRGESRYTCEVLADTYGFTHTKRHKLIEIGRRGLAVKVTDLQLDDTGLYWIGIDRLYADLMTSVSVSVTQIPVSKPTLYPLSLLVDKPTCWGQPVSVRCGSTTGSSVSYRWYQHMANGPFLFQTSPDLHLSFDTLESDSGYHCTASNDISNESSDVLSVRVLTSGQISCIYMVDIQGQPIHDCTDRLSSTTVESVTIFQTQTDVYSDMANQSLLIHQTGTTLPSNRSWTEMPLWYRLLRWTPLVVLIITMGIYFKKEK